MNLIRRLRKIFALTVHHLDCGTFSGAPNCCVLYATFIDFPISRFDQYFELKPRPKWHFDVENVWRKLTKTDKNELGRIPCPLCHFKGEKIQMKRCFHQGMISNII